MCPCACALSEVVVLRDARHALCSVGWVLVLCSDRAPLFTFIRIIVVVVGAAAVAPSVRLMRPGSMAIYLGPASSSQRVHTVTFRHQRRVWSTRYAEFRFETFGLPYVYILAARDTVR